ncbi:ABC transporter substrate-binding protein [Actinomadura chibensis]|uniref:ABC transporter substrate-binding protein n=1 Tax=Actinomadura chibensis TaxID=392828 RepID=A0A5D0NCR0_9ACTN|nr:ABC transporter substrate-binding protein [Actinomadura chibensis]TYB42220.1 ABC transporter substrate-binding protein [Actinomadura chibensis]
MNRPIGGWRRLTAVIAASALLPAAGCGGGGSARSTGPAKAGTGEVAKVTWGIDSAPRSLDPAHAYDGKSALVYQQVYDSLLYLDAAGRIVPGLATSWSQPDPLTYVYRIRTDAKFWDGKPVTAEDAAFSLGRHADKKVASEFATYFGAVKSVAATGPGTVTVKLSRPDPFFRYIPALAGQVVQRAFATAHAKDLGTPQVGTMASGPYKVESFSAATGATLVRNPSWWGPKAAVKRLEFKVVGDPETLRLAAQSGAVDGTFLSDPSLSRRWRDGRGMTVKWVPSPQTVYLSFDVATVPFDDVHVRRAVSLSVDRRGLSTALFGGHARVARSLTPPESWGDLASPDKVRSIYAGLPEPSFDTAKAKAELAQSRHPQGFQVTVPYPASMKWLGDVLQSLQQNLKPLNITLTAKQVPFQEYVGNLYSHEKLGLQLIPYTPEYPDPAGIPSLVLGTEQIKGGFNTSGFSTPEIEKFLSQQRAAKRPDPVAGLGRIDAVIADQQPYAPLFYTDSGLALNRELVFDGDYSVWLNFSQQWATRLKPAA